MGPEEGDREAKEVDPQKEKNGVDLHRESEMREILLALRAVKGNLIPDLTIHTKSR